MCFSLLELLVCFSILMVLIALLLPAIKACNEHAKSAACANNLRQLGMGMLMYGMDRGIFPWGSEGQIAGAGNGNNGNGAGWGNNGNNEGLGNGGHDNGYGTGNGSGVAATNDWTYRIQPYLGGKYALNYGSGVNRRSAVIQCPSRRIRPNYVINCYAVNARILGVQGNPSFNSATVYPRKFPFQQRPVEVFMLADANQFWSSSGAEAEPIILQPAAEITANYTNSTANSPIALMDNLDVDYGGTPEQIRFRHRQNTAANFVFFDGHVEPLEMGEVLKRNIQFVGP